MSSVKDSGNSRGSRVPRNRISLRHLREVALIVGSYFIYMLVRRFLIPDLETTAFANALKVNSFELATGLFLEARWQAWVLEHSKALAILLNWTYIITFVPILILTAVLVYSKDRPRYLYYRNVWLMSFVLALVVFALFPLAPPRFMPQYGFVDTIEKFGPSWYGGQEMAQALYYNVFAAMPSLHFGWTLLFGVLYVRMGPVWLKVCGVVYPLLTFFAITITGNHYMLDAIGGAAVALASYLSYCVLLYLKAGARQPLDATRDYLRRGGSYLHNVAVRARSGGTRAQAGPESGASSFRSPLLRWKMYLQVAVAAVKAHPWVERLYAKKWRTGFPDG